MSPRVHKFPLLNRRHIFNIPPANTLLCRRPSATKGGERHKSRTFYTPVSANVTHKPFPFPLLLLGRSWIPALLQAGLVRPAVETSYFRLCLGPFSTNGNGQVSSISPTQDTIEWRGFMSQFLLLLDLKLKSIAILIEPGPPPHPPLTKIHGKRCWNTQWVSWNDPS